MNRRERALLFLEKAAEDEAVVSEWICSPLISGGMGRGSGQEMEREDDAIVVVGE